MPEIRPFLWFNNQAEDAIALYSACFPQSRLLHLNRYPDSPADAPLHAFDGKVLNAEFDLAGRRFMALDGGNSFAFTPAISCFVNLESEAAIDAAWAQLSEGANILMPLQAYPFSAKFGWLADKFGLTWQLSLGAEATGILPCLMFVGEQHGKAQEAMHFYTSLFADSAIEHLVTYGEGEEAEGVVGTLKYGHFRLAGQAFMALDSAEAHAFGFSEAFSLYVECADQAEVDRLWALLSAVPDAEQCGWLKDKYGVSWQIIPRALGELMNDPDPAKVQRVMSAMMPMKKLDIALLHAAYAG